MVRLRCSGRNAYYWKTVVFDYRLRCDILFNPNNAYMFDVWFLSA